MRVLESHGSMSDDLDERVAVMVSMRAASLSFFRLVSTAARSASVMSKSGRTSESKVVLPGRIMSTVPSRCRSFMWLTFTEYRIVPDEGERIFQMVPPRVWPALNAVIVRP